MQLSTYEETTKKNWYHCKFTFMTFNWSLNITWKFYNDFFFHDSIHFPQTSVYLFTPNFLDHFASCFIKEVESI